MGDSTERRMALLFCIPSLALLAIFYYYPVLSSIRYSFFQWDGVNATFIGLDNFFRMFKDEWFVQSLGNTVILTVIRMAIALTAPLSVALIISRIGNPRWSYYYRTAFVVPMVVTFVVVIIVWQFMLEYRNGLINRLLQAFGLGTLTHNWLGEKSTALYAIALLGFPWVTSFSYGLFFLMFSAGLDNIPTELHEAAKIDGASSLKRVQYVEIPMLMGQIKMVIILTLIQSIRYFVPILIMTQGGPGTATMMPGLVMFYNGFRFGNMGYASAIGFVLFSIIFALTWINMRFIRSET